MEERVSGETGWAGVEMGVQGGTWSLIMPPHTQVWPYNGVCRFSTISLAGKVREPGLLGPT